MIRLDTLRVKAGDFALTINELAVGPGGYMIVLGPTGSGKTVLLEAIAGLRQPQTGRIQLAGRDVTTLPPEARRVGLVYQDYALFPHLRVGENIGFALPRSDRPRQVYRLARLLGIEALLDRYPAGLSGGEQQRVALARALAPEPQVLLLDEPLSALDGPRRAELRRELERIHVELATTVVHVTHDLDEAVTLGDSLAILIEGKLVQVGTVEHVTHRPADRQVADLVGIGNVFEVEEHTIGGSSAGPVARLTTGHALLLDPTTPVGASVELVAMRAEEIEIEPLPDLAEEVVQEPRIGTGRDNVFDGVVVALDLHAIHARLDIEVPPVGQGRPLTFRVHVLRPQVARLALHPGRRVRLKFASASVQPCGSTT